jgi:hypothetical protein
MAGDIFLLHTTHMIEKIKNNVNLGRKNKQGF